VNVSTIVDVSFLRCRIGPNKNFGNPAPLGLSAFALTTFVLSLLNMSTKNTSEPNMVVALAYGYGGLVQLLAGMWSVVLN